jgi:hypothetical protein
VSHLGNCAILALRSYLLAQLSFLLPLRLQQLLQLLLPLLLLLLHYGARGQP